jgi:cytidine deaminase
VTRPSRPARPLSEGQAKTLLTAAREARRNAYAPYSEHPVGAALLDVEGRIHPGVNVENASLGLTTCAERSAVTRAVGDGIRSFVALAVVGPHDEIACMPCGSCRQILWELAPDLTVVTAEGDEPRMISLRELLPNAFGAESLNPPDR